ncbi:hypothetical protein PV783_16130 [Chitinophaga sp. CC14]
MKKITAIVMLGCLLLAACNNSSKQPVNKTAMTYPVKLITKLHFPMAK